MKWPRLYAIADEATARRRGRDLDAVVRALLDGGVRLIQLRAASTATTQARVRTADACVRAAASCRATIIVNDRPDVALLSAAAGVHLGQEDLAVEDARAVLGPAAIIGWSSHTTAQVEAARGLPVTYLAIGPVFGSRTKPGAHPEVGLEGVRRARRATERPLAAIGGITLDTAPLVVAAGADMVAVIADLIDVDDVESRASAFVRGLEDQFGRP